MLNYRINCSKDCPRYLEDLKHPCIQGVGPSPSKIMLVGENPGITEDIEGEPFVGRSGELLNKIFKEVGISRKDIYITNSVKCFTNREDTKPSIKEIKLCKSYLIEEIKKVNPNIIGALGATALQSLLNRTGITKVKNNIFINDLGIKVIPTFHPAYVLRNPGLYSYLRKGIELILLESENKEINKKNKLKTNYLIADTVQKINKVFEQLEKKDKFSIDLETSSLNFLIAKILCVSISWKSGLGITIPWDLLAANEELLERFTKILISNKLKIGQNIAFDIKILLRNKIKIKEPIFDTMLAHHLIDENMLHGLDSLTLQYLDLGEYWTPIEKYKEEISKAQGIPKSNVTYDLLPTAALYGYAAQDADATFRLYEIFYKELHRQNLMDFYIEHVLKFLPVLMQMEYTGIAINRDKLKDLITSYNDKILNMENELYKDKEIIKYNENKIKKEHEKLIVKYNKSKILKSRYPNGAEEYLKNSLDSTIYKFNFKSPKQLAELFFGQMKLASIKKIKTGYSTDSKVLNILAKKIGIAKKIVEYRKLVKYVSTYLTATYEKSCIDGRVHTNYSQTGTVTGRLSSDIQQIPRDANDFKECFVSDPGYVFIKADLAQAEFRCWAHYSNDRDMIADIEAGFDIHKNLASKVFNITEKEVTPEQRTAAKNCVFGMMFGRGSKSISQQYNISIEQAKYVRNLFFSKYPIASEWLDTQVQYAKAYGHIQTWFGRVRRLPDIYSETQEVAYDAERQAKNSAIQGQSSDMNNGYLVKILKEAKKAKIKCYPALTVHDANVLQVEEDKKYELINIMKKVVSSAYSKFKCKMELSFEIGYSLGTLEKINNEGK